MAKKVYRLDVKAGARWRRVCTIEADSHAEALRQAIACLPPEHFDKPIRLVQQEDPKPGGPAGPASPSSPPTE